jgi:Domain of unknown function (DUF4389)
MSLATRSSSLVPYAIFGLFWLFAAYAASIVAWFAILITGRYPSALFAFNVRAWRFLIRANSYSMLLVDARAPLSGRDDPRYPLQLNVTPLPEYNRLLTAFRAPLLIPLFLVTYLAMAAAFLAWFPSLFTVTLFGRQPATLQRIIANAMRLDARFIASTFLLTQSLWTRD